MHPQKSWRQWRDTGGGKRPSETMIIPDPSNMPTRTTVPLKNGRMTARYDTGKRPMRMARAGLFMVVLNMLVEILAYMAEKISNRSRKARNASI